MKKTNLLKSMLLLCALVAGSGSVWADEIIYSWNGNGSTTTAGETGGTATAVQASGTNIVVGQAQNGNWSFKMNKGFSGSDYYVSIALDKPLNGGETITIGAFRSGSASTATLGFDFVNADTQALITDPQNLSSTGTPDDVVLTVPAEARGSKTVRIYRVAGSPALYVSKFIITYNQYQVNHFIW